MKKSFLSFFLSFLLLFFSELPAFAATSISVPQKGAYFGFWATDANGNFGDDKTTELEALLNKNIALRPAGWTDDANCSQGVIDILNNIDSKFHAIPMIHLNNKNRTLDEIANNTINPTDKRPNYQTKPDDLFRSYARCFKSYGKPMFMRIFSEMNWKGQSSGQPWRICSNCKDLDTGVVQTPALMIKAWRHVHDIFVQEGATNVMFMWIQNPYYSSILATTPYDVLYPGSAYVDWVGWDVYNNGQLGKFNSFYSLVNADYEKMKIIAPGKPMIIPEFNSYVGPDTTGTARAKWFTDMLTVDLPTRYPNIKAINLFNVAGFGITYPRVQDQPKVLAAIKSALSSSYYLSNPYATPAPVKRPGDVNGDGKIDFNDYTLIKTNFGNPYTIFDYTNMLGNYNK